MTRHSPVKKTLTLLQSSASGDKSFRAEITGLATQRPYSELNEPNRKSQEMLGSEGIPYIYIYIISGY